LGKSGEFEGTNVFLQTLHSAPTSSKRRIQQALTLAQRLNAKQKECEDLLKRLNQAEKERDSLQQELDIAKSLLNKSQQPYGYLIQTIEEKEHEIKDLKEKIRGNNDEYQNLKLEHSQLLQVRPCRIINEFSGLC
jgi:Seryl-tRNA synthetase